MTTFSTNTIPPLPAHALSKGNQFRLYTFPGGKQAWGLRKRFQRKKHKGRTAGAFGGSK